MSEENSEKIEQKDEKISLSSVLNKIVRPNLHSYEWKHIVDICIPVSISMVSVVVIMKIVTGYDKVAIHLVYTPFSEDVSDNYQRTANSVLNATTFIAVIVISTTILITLYYLTFYKLIATWLVVTTLLMLSLLTLMRLKEILIAFNYPQDTITTYLLLWNFTIFGMVTLYWHGPKKAQQVYLIYISITMALLFLKHLPEWTGWIVLGALVIWDIVAVMAPKGPLRMFVETAKQRNDSIPPVLIYVSMASTITCEIPKKQVGIKLGLGDFIFYSVLVGKAAKSDDWLIIIACILAIVMGLILTAIILKSFNCILPALPISVVFGLVVYFTSYAFVKPFSNVLTVKQIFV